MDERAEETRELEQIRREDDDDARQRAAERDHYADDGLEWAEIVMLEAERWSR